jgi:hypothetical protein
VREISQTSNPRDYSSMGVYSLRRVTPALAIALDYSPVRSLSVTPASQRQFAVVSIAGLPSSLIVVSACGTRLWRLVPGGGVEPPRAEARRILRAPNIITVQYYPLRLSATDAVRTNLRLLAGQAFIAMEFLDGMRDRKPQPRGSQVLSQRYRPQARFGPADGRTALPPQTGCKMNISLFAQQGSKRSFVLASRRCEGGESRFAAFALVLRSAEQAHFF